MQDLKHRLSRQTYSIDVRPPCEDSKRSEGCFQVERASAHYSVAVCSGYESRLKQLLELNNLRESTLLKITDTRKSTVREVSKPLTYCKLDRKAGGTSVDILESFASRHLTALTGHPDTLFRT